MGVLVAYIVVMSVIIFMSTDKATSLREMLLGNRSVGSLLGALSIGATWIWAPALFVSSENAYKMGLAGAFWFIVPNILTLIVFIPFAKKLSESLGDNFTLPSWIGEKYQSKRLMKLYNIQMSTVSILSTGVQIIAGAGILQELTGLNYLLLTIIMGVVAISYSQYSGIKASIVSDAFNMIVMLIVVIGIVVSLSINGYDAMSGLSGITGDKINVFDKEVFLTFGLSSAIGLMSGTFGDQNFWSLAASMKRGSVGKAFGLGAFFFSIVPIGLSLVGFMAVGDGFVPQNVGRVNMEFIQHTLPSWVMVPFVFMIIGGLMSTVDSNASSIAALASDVVPKYTVAKSRVAILVLIVGAVIVANSGVTVPQLFLIYGTVRATTMLPTVLTFFDNRLRESGVFYGIILSMVLGIPVFVYGSLNSLWQFKVAGSLFALSISGVVAYVTKERT